MTEHQTHYYIISEQFFFFLLGWQCAGEVERFKGILQQHDRTSVRRFHVVCRLKKLTVTTESYRSLDDDHNNNHNNNNTYLNCFVIVVVGRS
jgi:hypothetical protein